MGTRSNIIVKIGKKFSVIYVHNDGYFSGVGENLTENYNSQELAESIVAMGDASFIGDNIKESMFYGRDRNETGIDAEVFDSLEEAKSQGCKEEFYYYFNDDSKVWEAVKNSTDY